VIETWPSGRALFVDTSALYAVVDPRDQWHGGAGVILLRLARERWHFVTTNYVVAETHALVLTRLGRRTAWTTLNDIDSSSMSIIRVTQEDEIAARRILRRYDDKEFSLTDATSFAVMERLGLTEAFAFDRHFVQYGFSTIGG
jgi:predicted nucleic acid-binding protein